MFFFSWLFRKGQRRRLIASLASKMFAGQVIKKAQKSVCWAAAAVLEVH